MEDDLFELWWAEYMPEADRNRAWAAYSAALPPDEAVLALGVAHVVTKLAPVIDQAQQMLGRWNEWYGQHGTNLPLPPAGIVKTQEALASITFPTNRKIDMRNDTQPQQPTVTGESHAPQHVENATMGVVTGAMVSRFLGWRLPDGFSPDCFVSFDKERAKATGSWPIGTNLLDAQQARAMLEFVLQKT